MHRQLRTVCFVLQADAETHSLEEAKAGVEAEHQELQELRGAHNRKIGQRTIKIRKLEDLIKRCALPPIARRFATDRQTRCHRSPDALPLIARRLRFRAA